MSDTLTHYPLRHVPRDVWIACRERAASENLSIRSVIIGLLRGYAEGRVTIRLDAEDRRKSRGPRVTP